MEKRLELYAGWEDDKHIGTVFIDRIRGNEVFSFEYDPDWLFDHRELILDPDIQPYNGRQYLSSEKDTYGILSDISPDRWGRTLLQRKEAILAQRENRQPQKLMASDYLVGVCDMSRMGGVRIKYYGEDEFIQSPDVLPIPPITRLRDLEYAVNGFEKADKNEEKWVNDLLNPGSSLGGARPKATVMDTEDSLWIAKFPSINDEYNVSAWEKVAVDIAAKCDIKVSDSDYREINGKGVFLTKRFDRIGTKRIHFASAMTMLGLRDGDENGNYCRIADFLRMNGGSPREDLKELWKRIVFNKLIGNHDDHLRNHGFVLVDGQWRLSPVYDINPIPYESPSLQISEMIENTIKNAIDHSEYFDLSGSEARDYIGLAASVVRDNWKNIAKKYNVPASELKLMEKAFQMTP